jgi:hypothetical protein
MPNGDGGDPYGLNAEPAVDWGEDCHVTWTEDEAGRRRRTTSEHMRNRLDPLTTSARVVRAKGGGVMWLIEERGGTNMDPQVLENPYELEARKEARKEATDGDRTGDRGGGNCLARGDCDAEAVMSEHEMGEDGARRGGMANGQCSKGWGARCAAARGKRCACACGGVNHGTQYRLPLHFEGEVDAAIDNAKRRGWIEEVVEEVVSDVCVCGHERDVHVAIGCAICFNGPLPEHCLGFRTTAVEVAP